jgi:hypothetical protein
LSDYDSIRAVNWSLLRHMRVSPKHYKAASETERPDTDTFRLGRAVHTAVLEPDRFVLDYVVWTGGRRAGKAWDEFETAADEQGKTVLKLEQYEQACRIRDAVRGHALVAPLLASGKAEQVLEWTDEKTGIKCKGRADLVTPRVILDLKTARHAVDKRRFVSAAYQLGYYHQLAFYSRFKGDDDVDCVIVAVEPAPPYDVAVYKLDPNAVWAANRDIDKLLARLAECLESDRWPGVFDDVQMIEEPNWAFSSLDEEQQEEAA